jgi:voltage-gated potassium channel
MIFTGAELALRPGAVTTAREFDRGLFMLPAPILDVAFGTSLIVISFGLFQRSRLAWLLSVAAVTIGIAIRMPPERSDALLLVSEAGVVAGLIFTRDQFRQRSAASAGLFALAMLTSYLLWASLRTLHLGHDFEPVVTDLSTAFYFTVVTVSSVGYGDILPRTPDARLFVTVMIGMGVVVVALCIGAILLPMIEGRVKEVLGGRRRMERKDHYIVIGMSSLARNTIVELEKRQLRVTIILGKSPDDEFFKSRDVVVGDPTDLQVLVSAGAKVARSVLALSTDDAENGFVVLGMHELNEAVTTVVALNDLANEHRIKRTQPSLTLSVQALGGRLLAMALTGEDMSLEILRDALQIHGADAEPG